MRDDLKIAHNNLGTLITPDYKENGFPFQIQKHIIHIEKKSRKDKRTGA